MMAAFSVSMSEKVLFTWSGGKDSAMALYELQRDNKYEVSGLLTTITEDYDRVSMHGVRSALLKKQAEYIGLPLDSLFITIDTTEEDYDKIIREKFVYYKGQGITSVAYGDIFLEDLRKYREDNLSRIEMKAIFPIWKRDTNDLAHRFIDLGFRAIITCVDSRHLDSRFVGREFNEEFLADLPPTADPCGENGEFHSFVYDGPIFNKTVLFTKGEIVLRDERFYFCDLKH